MLTEPVKHARRVALNVSGAALLLAAAKGAVGVFSGSIAVLSSALDSAGDALASFVNFVLLTVAAKPPDEDHPFGHGKAENLAAMFQGVLLLTGGIYLGSQAIERIREPRAIEGSTAAIATMIFSIIATIGVTTYLKRNAVRSESAALAGDAVHYTSDIVSNAATILALIAIRMTGASIIDAILGISVAAWIGWNSIYLIWQAASDLMDPALPAADIEMIVSVIEKADPSIAGHMDLRTRRSAGIRFVEFELCIDRNVTFEHAHEITERVKVKIHQTLARSVVTIHAEPVEMKSEV